jgi:2'-5' RNA ligase
MRLFTGIGLPQTLIDELTRLVDRLRVAAHLRWSAPHNFHITTKFIGEWPQERLDDVTARLKPLGCRRAIDLSIRGIGWLPNAHSPRILFVGIETSSELEQLASDTDSALAPLGVESETRKFSPHLTLARIKDAAIPLGPLRAVIGKLESLEFGRFTANSFHLYLSKTGPAGSIYTQLAEFPFSNK